MDSVERWRDVVRYENLYRVSDRGKVRSLDRVIGGRIPGSTRRWSGRMLTPVINANGYPQVTLCKAGTKLSAQVHVLTLEAFVGPRPSGMETRHLDDDPANGWLENLTWGTQSENTLDRVRNGIHQQTKRTHCPREHPLSIPNLTACSVQRGWRSCLACQRARAWVDYHPEADLREVSDRYYREIMLAA